MAHMSQLTRSEGRSIEREAVLIDGRHWYPCRLPGCGFRVLADMGAWGLDAVEFHEEGHHVESTCTRCAQLAG